MQKGSVGFRTTTFACLALVMAVTAQTEEPGSTVQVTTRKADDRVTVKIQGGQAVVTVTSPSGIGGANLTREGECWPRSSVLRLRLRGLERLQVGNTKVTLAISVASSGDHHASLSLLDEGKMETPIDRRSPFWTEVRILDAQGETTKDFPPNDGVFELILPQLLFASNPPVITLDWIDFYR